MSPQALIWIVTFGAAVLLLGAFGFQHFGELAPCKLCLWQRWPHVIAIALGLFLLLSQRFWLAWLGALAMFGGAGIAFYHVGIEQKWWQGPKSCSGGGDIGALSSEELLNHILSAPITRCDVIAWDFVGISMAGWNMLFSMALGVIWIWLAFRRA